MSPEARGRHLLHLVVLPGIPAVRRGPGTSWQGSTPSRTGAYHAYLAGVLGVFRQDRGKLRVLPGWVAPQESWENERMKE